MWVVGPATTTRETKLALSIRWAMWRPKVVFPAAGVAEARKLVAECARTASVASSCHARRGRASGQSGSVPARAPPPVNCREASYKGGQQYGRYRRSYSSANSIRHLDQEDLKWEQFWSGLPAEGPPLPRSPSWLYWDFSWRRLSPPAQ